MGNEQGRPLTEEEKRLQSIKTMDAEMRQKLGGLTPKYNMKIVVRGERNTGKSILWKRLQQLPFEEAYVPTPEIQVGTISWNYKVTDELIKVEVWDVVDQGKKRSDGKLKLNNSTEEEEEEEEALPNVPPESKSGSYTVSKLDATTVNVYTNTNAVIIMVDPTKKWTFEYIEKELPKIPKDIDVLLLVNYMDMAEYRVVSKSDVVSLISDNSDRSIYFVEASLKNNFGMKEIVSFFNIPFLRLKRQYLQQQLQQNQRDIENAIQELHILNEEQNYQNYVQVQEELKKTKKKSNFLNLSSSVPTSPAVAPRAQEAPAALAQPAPLTKQDSKGSVSPQTSSVEVPSVNPWRRMSLGNRKDIPPNAENPTSPQTSPPTATKQETKAAPPTVTKQDSKGSLPTQSVTKQDSKPEVQPEPPKPAPPAKTGNFFSRLFKSSSNLQEEKSQKSPEDDLKKLAMEARVNPKQATNIDEFVPGELDNQFFGEEDSPRGSAKKQPAKPAPKPAEIDSDDENANPLVAADQVEVEETRISRPAKTQAKATKQAAKPPQPAKAAPPKKAQDSDDEDAPNPFVTPDTEEPSPIKVSRTAKPKTPSKPMQVQEEPPHEEKPAKKKTTATKKAHVDDDDESPNPLVAADELPDDEPPAPKKTVVRKAKASKPSPAKPEPTPAKQPEPKQPEPVKQEAPKEAIKPEPKKETVKQQDPAPVKQQTQKEDEPSPKTSKSKSQTKKAAPVVTPDEDDDDKPNPLVVADVEEELPSKPAPRLKSKPKKQSGLSPKKAASDPVVTASVEVPVPTTSASTQSIAVPAKIEEEKPVAAPEPVIATPEPESMPSVVEEPAPVVVKEEIKQAPVVTEEEKPAEVAPEQPEPETQPEPAQPKVEAQVQEDYPPQHEQQQNPAEPAHQIELEDEFFMIDNRSQGSRKSADSITPQVQSVDDFVPETAAEDDFFGKDDEETPVAVDPSFNKNSDDEEDLSKSRIELSQKKSTPASDVESLKDDEEERFQVQRITGTTEGKDSEEDQPAARTNKFGSSIDFSSGRESLDVEVQQPKTIKVTLVAQAEESEKATTGESDEPVEEAYSGQDQPAEQQEEEEEEQEEDQEEEVEEIEDTPQQEEDPWAQLGITPSATTQAEDDPWASFQNPAASIISTTDAEDPWAQLGISTASSADPFAALEQLPQEQPATSKSKKSSSKSSSKSSTTSTTSTTSKSSSSKTKTQPSKPAKKVQEEEEEEDIWNTTAKKSAAFEEGSDDDDIWNTTNKWEDEPAEESSTSQEKSKKKKSSSATGSSKKTSSSSKSKKSGEETSKRKHKPKKSDQ